MFNQVSCDSKSQIYAFTQKAKINLICWHHWCINITKKCTGWYRPKWVNACVTSSVTVLTSHALLSSLQKYLQPDHFPFLIIIFTIYCIRISRILDDIFQYLDFFVSVPLSVGQTLKYNSGQSLLLIVLKLFSAEKGKTKSVSIFPSVRCV